jgi:hypothetical protein
MSGSQERLSVGSMPAMALAFCNVMIVQKSSLRRRAISTGDG